MTPKIFVGNAVADALAKKGASVFLAANDWKKMDQITWAVAQAALYLLTLRMLEKCFHALTCSCWQRVYH